MSWQLTGTPPPLSAHFPGTESKSSEPGSRMSQNSDWKEIWEAKGLRHSGELHVIDGYDLLDLAGWDAMVRLLMAPVPLRPGITVAELGCGAGAFLSTLRKIEPRITIAGLDLAESMIAVARSRLSGDFWVGDIRGCPQVPSALADVVCSFGVLLYLDTEEDVRRALHEIDRVAKPGARIFVGEISDLSKREDALKSRRRTHANHTRVSAKNPQHLYLPKELFLGEASRLGWREIQIVDHACLPALAGNPLASYRYSVYAEKKPSGSA
jgi:SAM-dependent methyltransferase